MVEASEQNQKIETTNDQVQAPTKVVLKPEEVEAAAEEAKNKGNDFFKANDMPAAILMYTESIRKSKLLYLLNFILRVVEK